MNKLALATLRLLGVHNKKFRIKEFFLKYPLKKSNFFLDCEV